MKYLLLIFVFSFFFKTNIISDWSHDFFHNMNHSSEVSSIDQHDLTKDCHNSEEQDHPNSHDCENVCLCSHFSNVYNNSIIINENLVNLGIQSFKKIKNYPHKYKPFVTVPPKKPPIYSS